MGLVIIAEVAAAAILITGAIWVLGKELEQVGIAWQPVIDNGGTIAAAMGIGIGILAVIGVVTALLGLCGYAPHCEYCSARLSWQNSALLLVCSW